ncbi:alpha/beta fold hydrolase [Leptospira haakeii]|uniref:Alpha/beta hydrolase n=1 Tax=Leptospira haakeii TaxID=2023198 RepID=A0ABX4PRL9_9LEPT|nr:alpha/beta hydrolase [Leptospira haakeii]PKA17941.1 alpha/beta hydrolase [Leptospira haakeii]PKA21666.1 alpha/beta hydrolase [Leptospira haakeii]
MRKKYLLGLAVIILIVLTALPFVRSREKIELNGSIRSGVSGQFAELPLGWTHFELSGPEKGNLVVLVHGFSTPYFIWDPVQKSLTDAGYRVLRFDLYGRGYSDRPDTVYNLDLFVTQISDLLNFLHINDSFDIMGLSMGGPITAHYVSKYPDRIKKVVLVDPFTSKTNTFPLTIPLIGEYLNSAVYIPSLPKGISADFVDPSKVPNDWVEKYETQLSFKGFGRAILSTIRNIISFDPKPEFEKLALTKKQVLVFWGDKDHTTPLEKGEYVKELLNAEFVLVKDAGHLPHIEKPEVVLPAISKFLSK